MVLEIILLFERLNLTFLTSEKKQKIIEKTSLMYIEAIKVLENL